MFKRILTQKRYLSNIYKEQKGITGLETAIILIAFVVVAAVFAYTVLSAGLFCYSEEPGGRLQWSSRSPEHCGIKGRCCSL